MNYSNSIINATVVLFIIMLSAKAAAQQLKIISPTEFKSNGNFAKLNYCLNSKKADTESNESNESKKNKLNNGAAEVNITKFINDTISVDELNRKGLLIPTIDMLAVALSSWNSNFPKDDGAAWLLDSAYKSDSFQAILIPLLDLHLSMNLTGYTEESKKLGVIFRAINPKLAYELENINLIEIKSIDKKHFFSEIKMHHESFPQNMPDINSVRDRFKGNHLMHIIYGKGSLFSKNENTEKNNRINTISVRDNSMFAVSRHNESLCNVSCGVQYFGAIGAGTAAGAAVVLKYLRHPALVMGSGFLGGYIAEVGARPGAVACIDDCRSYYSPSNDQTIKSAAEQQKAKAEEEQKKAKAEEEQKKEKENKEKQKKAEEHVKELLEQNPSRTESGCDSCDNNPINIDDTMVATPSPPFMDDENFKPSAAELERRRKLKKDMLYKTNNEYNEEYYDGLSFDERKRIQLSIIITPKNPRFDSENYISLDSIKCMQFIKENQVNRGPSNRIL